MESHSAQTTQSAVAEPSCDSVVPQVLRLAGHMRLYIALLAMVVRLTALFGIVLAWAMAVSDRSALSVGHLQSGWILLTAVTALAVQMLLPDGRRPIVRAVLITAGVVATGLLMGLLGSLLVADQWGYYAPTPRAAGYGLTKVPMAFVTGVAAIALFEWLRKRATRASGRLDPMLALLPETDVPAGRAALGGVLARAERSSARTIYNVQAAAALPPLLLLMFLGNSFIEHLRRSPASDGLAKPANIIIWLVIGVVTGALLGVTTLRLRTVWAAMIGSLLVSVGIGIGALYSTFSIVSSTSGNFGHSLPGPWITSTILQDLGRWFLTSLIASTGAVPALLVIRWLIGWQIRRLLPLPAQRLLLAEPSTASDDAVSHFAPSLHCEACGYSLQGLPESACSACATATLRCPECGHVQPAAVRYARLLRRMHRQHLIVRTQDIVLRIGVAALVLLGAYGFGTILRVVLRNIDAITVFVISIAAGTLIGALRYIALRIRPPWQASLLCGTLPVLAVIVGAVSSPRAHLVPPMVALGGVASTVLFAFCFPWFWARWLAALLGRNVAASVYRWETSPVYRRAAVAEVVSRCGESLFREAPLACAHCGRPGLPPAPRLCEQCHCHIVTCDVCASHTPVSATRAGMEALLYRARMMALASIALIATGFALAMLMQLAWHGELALGISLVYRQRLYMPEEYAYGLFVAAVGGTVASLLFIRRRTLVVAVGVCLFWLAAMHILIGRSSTPAFLIAFGCEAAAAFIAALLARPLFVVAVRVLLPKGTGRPLVAWLSGRLTIDQAAAELPQ